MDSNKIFSAFFVLLAIGAFSFAGLVRANSNYSVAPGATTRVYEWGVCQRVTNASGWPTTFIPTNTATEWSTFRSKKPSHISLMNCIPANATLTIYERTCGVSAYTYAVSSLPASLSTCSTGKTYTFSIEGPNLRIHCYRAPATLPANNIVAVLLTVPGYGSYWASTVAGYTLGAGGVAASAADALGPNTQVGPYYYYYGPYTYTDCTWMGNNDSDLWLGFSF